LFLQSDDSSDEDLLHIDTEAKPGRNSKVKKESGSSAGILDLLQASKEVGGLEYNTNRYAQGTFFPLTHKQKLLFCGFVCVRERENEFSSSVTAFSSVSKFFLYSVIWRERWESVWERFWWYNLNK